MKTPLSSKRGFTLIELLTVIAIIAILSAILVPTIGQFRTMAKKANDINNLRQIVQASALFASQNGEKFVQPAQTVDTAGIVSTGGSDIFDVAAVLALGAGLNDAKIWTSQSDPKAFNPGGLIVQKTETGYTINSALGTSGSFSYDYVTGLNTNLPSTTPLAFSRIDGTSFTSSTWDDGSMYGTSGGHVAFLGGNVNWYDTLNGKLVDGNGTVANSLSAALTNLPGLTATDVVPRHNVVTETDDSSSNP